MGHRRLRVTSTDEFFPAYVVWELTLACDHACSHCGSRAGARRPTELSTEEALEVVKQLAAMKAREVVLIGGEAYLHEGFLDIVRALKDAGVHPVMTTGGRGVTPELAKAMAAAGLERASVSIDGAQTAAIGRGLLVLLAIEDSDSVEDIAWLSGKIVRLRVFDDDDAPSSLAR